jgi:hypothetical protein
LSVASVQALSGIWACSCHILSVCAIETVNRAPAFAQRGQQRDGVVGAVDSERHVAGVPSRAEYPKSAARERRRRSGGQLLAVAADQLARQRAAALRQKAMCGA